MAIAENVGAKTGSSVQNLDNTKKDNFKEETPADAGAGNSNENGESFKNEMNELVESLSKLNPMAEDFVPSFLANHHTLTDNSETGFGLTDEKKTNNKSSRGKRSFKTEAAIARREDAIRKTVYVSDIDQQVTEELLAGLFLSCGPVVDCRICGVSKSVLRFAFVEFYNEEDARAALSLSGTMLGYYPLKVMPSKTAIAPVNPTFLPRSEDEREMSSRTIYCTNIDKKVTQVDVKRFFESFYGKVQRLRLLGDTHHSTRSAFVEFTMAESAIAALNCSGVVLGSLPIRAAPSKTPVRPRATRLATHLVPAA